ncbi:hypothetical protein FPZ42_13485 [Mucilaginibacter achroorhodeus]|uniref:Uncharacterized protein n=1 Tax=Mucilaginibacter achroorhodeus TaxID=2599294 RepID=A0A563U2M7_9SPHI|nr:MULTISPECIES: hypothetical protein [Mucilaginibacter]QXV64151.1 hypothetical protein INP83_13725 [Mucilaginibacter sp. 21P]TWR25601.1 hypothetical protein FPZ42_13485 [Mucilaginibacter achroorhodeus]
MSKQHKTIPNEPEEMPAHIEGPEITRPGDPKTPEIPKEAPDDIPSEIIPEPNKDRDDGTVHPG